MCKLTTIFCFDKNTSEAEILSLLLKNRQIKSKDIDAFLHPISPEKLL
jgi:hypothetical protein